MRSAPDEQDPEQPYDTCDCHVCGTLRSILGAWREPEGRRPAAAPLLLTYQQAAELLGTSSTVVAGLVSDGELRPVTLKSYGRRRVPRSEIEDYVNRLLTGELRAWVEARRDLHQWGLRYMQDRYMTTNRDGRRVDRGGRKWHLGDGRTPLCGEAARGRWETTLNHWWVSGRLCQDCETLSHRLRLEKREGRKRPVPSDIVPMLTVVTYQRGGEAVRRTGWHLGDGKVTLCGITRDRWELPPRRPRARPCGVCQRSAGLE